MKPSSGNKLIAGISLLGALMAVFLLLPAHKQETGALGRVERKDLIQRVTIAGTIVPKRRTLVTAPYNGYVKKLYANIGDQVRSGQPLVSITQSLQSSEQIFPLRAPYGGTVVNVLKSEGENVKENDTNDYIMRIDDLSELYVNASAPEIDRVKLKKGQETVIKASAVLDKPYKGVITELALSPKDAQGKNQQEYDVKIKVIDKDEKLGPGMSVVVDIITDRVKDALTLRHEFIHKDDTGDYYLIMANGEKRSIKVGSQNEEAFQILEGVREGEAVQPVDFSAVPLSQ
jgi:multidrug efflux pump subunit AcrA (membrane-fusion protein)